MVPLSAETGGRLDGAFSNFLKEVVTSGLDFGESPVPFWTKETRVFFKIVFFFRNHDFNDHHDFRTLQLMCYKLRKHEDSTGEILARRP